MTNLNCFGVIFVTLWASRRAELAKLTGKDVLLARAVGAIKSPLSDLFQYLVVIYGACASAFSNRVLKKVIYFIF